ncbi:hypothetical protein N9X24_03115 [Rickettsiales bacterium]|nr:hypothetical protein [Rickettsiales bacterium]
MTVHHKNSYSHTKTTTKQTFTHYMNRDISSLISRFNKYTNLRDKYLARRSNNVFLWHFLDN